MQLKVNILDSHMSLKHPLNRIPFGHFQKIIYSRNDKLVKFKAAAKICPNFLSFGQLQLQVWVATTSWLTVTQSQMLRSTDWWINFWDILKKSFCIKLWRTESSPRWLVFTILSMNPGSERMPLNIDTCGHWKTLMKNFPEIWTG